MKSRFYKPKIKAVAATAAAPMPYVPTKEYKEMVRLASRIGKKGYTIPKSVLEKDDLETLYKELFVKPITQGPQYAAAAGGGLDDAAGPYPVYRENEKKIYLPRFYGIARYGEPPLSDILGQGDSIDVEFVKPLRDYQDTIIDVYMKHVSTTAGEPAGGGILEVPCGRGKCLGKDTPILMYDGTIRPVQDIQVGDLIMGDDSTPRTILSLARGQETMYKISDTYIVNESHILSLKHCATHQIYDITVQDYLSYPEKDRLFGYRVPIEFTDDTLSDKDTHPYYYGRFDVSNERSFSEKYLYLNRSHRLYLLAGIIDNYINAFDVDTCNSICFGPISKNVIKQIIFLIRSLGFDTTQEDGYIHFGSSAYISIKEIPSQYYRFDDTGYKRLNLLYDMTVEKLGVDDYYGFEIDGNRRFVLGDFTVTHNTVMGLKIITLLQKKTLIIVHKEFLMNQWIERAQEFIPSAKIGRIQGQVCDIEGKDVVIGMLQTLYDRDFNYDSFGLTIIDEVHRIGSEQFSKALLRITTPCMLGISATVERKDGLTKVLYMFIGDKIYSETRKSDDPVCVRGIEYVSTDGEFNECEYDFRGNPKYSTMISKLCEFGPRSDFIVRVLGDLVKEIGHCDRDRDQDQNQHEETSLNRGQIMVLCHNRSLLTYLHDAIVHKNIAPVGYYVGGMKQTALQDTETKRIVLATYAMAAEALDIKTLSILVMATPKTDITQSVGRILRVRHENPIIVDIIDSHEIFQNQWRKRKTFYRKCNYRIQASTSIRYQGVATEWKAVFEPRQGKESSGSDDPPKIMGCLINGI